MSITSLFLIKRRDDSAMQNDRTIKNWSAKKTGGAFKIRLSLIGMMVKLPHADVLMKVPRTFTPKYTVKGTLQIDIKCSNIMNTEYLILDLQVFRKFVQIQGGKKF